ncbi:hypothetical protein VPH35_029958 [Triticum aestivum]
MTCKKDALKWLVLLSWKMIDGYLLPLAGLYRCSSLAVHSRHPGSFSNTTLSRSTPQLGRCPLFPTPLAQSWRAQPLLVNPASISSTSPEPSVRRSRGSRKS